MIGYSSAFGVVSLYDLMLRYNFEEFCSLYRALCGGARDLLFGEVMEVEQSENFCLLNARILDGLSVHATTLQMDSSIIQQLKSLSASLLKPDVDRRSATLRVRLLTAIEGIQFSLSSRTIYFMPDDKAQYIRDIDKIGGLVARFPETFVDFMEMNACYAFGRHTACVFHSMRVAEYGLRHIARTLRISIRVNKKPCPIDYGTWTNVIVSVQNKINALHKAAHGPKREAHLKFYATCADQCTYMRDIWRNEVSHTGRTYNQGEAQGAMLRVTGFMNTLAEGPNEYRKLKSPPAPRGNKKLIAPAKGSI